MKQLIGHVLVGAPGCGKSTLAQQWVAHTPESVWISTDQIRAELFGNPVSQGEWEQIAVAVVEQIAQAVKANRPIIYDATNAKRGWRLRFLQRVGAYPVQWIAWQFPTSLATCKARNEGRERQVPEWVIEQYYNELKRFPPDVAEGFAAVYTVPFEEGQFDFAEINRRIAGLPKAIQNRCNKNASRVLHPYSSLLAFERLMYLIAVLLHYPGLGNLQQTNPALLRRELACKIEFSSAAEEISALIEQKYGTVYADQNEISKDLAWLQQNGVVNAAYTNAVFDLSSVQETARASLHRYSDYEAFERLMYLIRFIAHHPQFVSVAMTEDKSHRSLAGLIEALSVVGKLQVHYTAATIRKDFEEALKPYRIMTDKRMRQGYFVGTAILSAAELLRVYHSLEGQAKHLSDPIALAAYETFQQRLKYLGLDTLASYPVRKVLDQPIVNAKYLSMLALAQPQQAERLEAAIQVGEIIELRRITGTGRFPEDTESPFEVLPLQIVYHNVAWYLGYQRLEDSLFCYERLARLTARFTERTRPRAEQRQALKQLDQLQQAGYGLFLGTSAVDQQTFLKGNRSTIEQELELWFKTAMFRFVCEGTQRFPGVQMSSRQPLGISMSAAEKKEVFTLKPTGDANFPHRLRVKLPRWTLESIYLRRWILSCDDQVKVIAPESLAKQLATVAGAIAKTYKQ